VTTRVSGEAVRALVTEGYAVHRGEDPADAALYGRHWWSYCRDGQGDADPSAGDWETEDEAWADAVRDQAGRLGEREALRGRLVELMSGNFELDALSVVEGAHVAELVADNAWIYGISSADGLRGMGEVLKAAGLDEGACLLDASFPDVSSAHLDTRCFVMQASRQAGIALIADGSLTGSDQDRFGGRVTVVVGDGPAVDGALARLREAAAAAFVEGVAAQLGDVEGEPEVKARILDGLARLAADDGSAVVPPGPAV
jgi:hypothetical protein